MSYFFAIFTVSLTAADSGIRSKRQSDISQGLKEYVLQDEF